MTHAVAGAPVSGSGDACAPLRVLVIEDDVVQRAFLRRLLARANVDDVSEAGDGASALELAAEAWSPFDIAICDLDMPRMDGMALLTRLAQLDAAPAIVLSSAQDAGLVYAVELMAPPYPAAPLAKHAHAAAIVRP